MMQTGMNFADINKQSKEESVEVQVFTTAFTKKYVERHGGPAAARRFCLSRYTGTKKLVEVCQSLSKVGS